MPVHDDAGLLQSFCSVMLGRFIAPHIIGRAKSVRVKLTARYSLLTACCITCASNPSVYL